MDVFFEIHQDNPREGPGSNETTRRVYGMLPPLPEKPFILDVGCGPGMQTLELARQSGGMITALDNHQPFLDDLARQAQEAGLSGKIQPVNGSMFEMKLPECSFDLIWSEGAIYIIGFEKGLVEWKKHLKPGGLVAVSELSWLRGDVPREPRDFWQTAYPGIQSLTENLKTAEKAGYDILAAFVLPESDWWEYYTPVEGRILKLREKYRSDAEAQKVLDEEAAEIALYRKYHDYYGYVFYVLRARESLPQLA